MKKINFLDVFLKPYFALLFVLFAIAAYYIICYLFSIKFGFFDIEKIGASEIITYLFYGYSIGVVSWLVNDYIKTPRQSTFFALMFLWLAALLREMSIQSWLTTHDTVVTKSRFFTSPTNPLHEKLIAGFLLLLVISVLAWVLIKNLKDFISGLMKKNPVSFTTITFIIFAILTQIVDRIPANYLKATGVELSRHTLFVLKIFEEGGESLLPLLFTIALVQFHLMLKYNQNLKEE